MQIAELVGFVDPDKLAPLCKDRTLGERAALGFAFLRSFKLIPRSLSKSASSINASVSAAPGSALRRASFFADSKATASWGKARVESYLRPLVSKMRESFQPSALVSWVQANRHSDMQMVQLFNLSLRIGYLVADDSEVGAYSQTARARVYRYTAHHMPKMIFLATYCSEDIVQDLYNFCAQWEACEVGISDAAVSIIDVLDAKDRGAFLRWLLADATFADRTWFASVLSDMHHLLQKKGLFPFVNRPGAKVAVGRSSEDVQKMMMHKKFMQKMVGHGPAQDAESHASHQSETQTVEHFAKRLPNLPE